jgi:glutamine synthetase
LTVECQHHEVATAGQAEIDLRFQELVTMADQMLIYKYIVKNVAFKYGKTVTFMPKPLFSDNGSGMHTHFSFWKDNQPLFAGSGYAGLSEMALYAIGGLLKHAPSVLAFSNPTTNSYKRLVPGYEAPVNLAYSQRNRSASCRIPMYSPSPKAKRVEFRCPDPSCNPYLAFAAILMAAVDGVQNKIHPGDPLDKDIYDSAARRGGQGAEDSRFARRGPGLPGGGSRVPVARRRLHGGCRRDLDQLQAEGRSRCLATASSSLRILPVL